MGELGADSKPHEGELALKSPRNDRGDISSVAHVAAVPSVSIGMLESI